jgi:uncharacterized membrane protein (DUF373 family)
MFENQHIKVRWMTTVSILFFIRDFFLALSYTFNITGSFWISFSVMIQVIFDEFLFLNFKISIGVS